MADKKVKQKQQTKQPKNVNRKLWLFNPFTLGAIITALLFLVLYAASGQITIGQKGAFERYLKDKYGQEFVVGDVRVEGSGLGVEGDPVAEAYPVSDPSLSFKVWNRGNFTSGSNSYADTYAQLYWSKQGKEHFETQIKQKIPDVESIAFSVTGGIDQNFFDLKSYPFIGSIPRVEQVLKEYPDKLDVTFAVHSKATTGFESQPSIGELRRAYSVILFAKDINITSGNIGYTYTGKSDNETLSRYAIVINAKQLSAITDPKQLNEYFRKINEK